MERQDRNLQAAETKKATQKQLTQKQLTHRMETTHPASAMEQTVTIAQAQPEVTRARQQMATRQAMPELAHRMETAPLTTLLLTFWRHPMRTTIPRMALTNPRAAEEASRTSASSILRIS